MRCPHNETFCIRDVEFVIAIALVVISVLRLRKRIYAHLFRGGFTDSLLIKYKGTSSLGLLLQAGTQPRFFCSGNTIKA